MRLPLLVESYFCMAIEGINDTTVALRPALVDVALGHAQDPVLFVAVSIGRVGPPIRTFLKCPKFYYARVAAQACCDVVVQQEFIFVRIQHLLVPVSQLHLAQVVQALEHQLVL